VATSSSWRIAFIGSLKASPRATESPLGRPYSSHCEVEVFVRRFAFKIVASVCLLILPVFTLTDCQRNTSEWKGAIERRGGLTVVKNPRSPLYGPGIFHLEKDLSVGKAEGEKEYVFSHIGGIAVDVEGRIYIIDSADADVRVFDGSGRYSRTIGRKGQGPGETQMPFFVQIMSQKELVIYDFASTRVVYYSLDGKFLRQIPTGHPVLPLKLDSQGGLVGFENLAPPPLGGKILKEYGPNFNFRMDIAKEESGRPRVFEIGRPALYACVTPDDDVVWGNSGSYLLHFLNSRGELVKTIEREYDPVKITSKDREEYRKKYADALHAGLEIDFFDHFPAFAGIFADDDGRIFVKTYERAEGQAHSFYYDVFDSEGRYKAKVPLAMDLSAGSVWKNHRLYVIESDEQGFQMVNRYKVSWTKQAGEIETQMQARDDQRQAGSRIIPPAQYGANSKSFDRPRGA